MTQTSVDNLAAAQRPAERGIAETRLVALMLIGFVLLALGYGLGPIFEGPDEIEHYRYVRTLRDTGALPPLAGQPSGEYHQPPLYYLLLLPVAALMPDGDFDQIDGALNPFYGRQIDLPGNDNTNLYLHSRAEDIPYASETARAVHVMRLLSIAISTATVFVSYRVFCLLWDGDKYRARRLATLAVVAFWSQFIYISSVLNNDVLLIFLATLTLYLLVREMKRGAGWKWAAALGITLGALLLTKVSAALLVAAVGVYFAVQPRLWRYLLLIVPLAAGIGGWWYLRNLLEYDDPAGMKSLYLTWSTERIAANVQLQIALTRLSWTYQTFWARFGAGAVAVGQWLYIAFDVLVILSLLGLLVWIVRRKWKFDRAALVVIGFGLVWIGGVVYYAGTSWSGNQGRYLLPGIAVWGIIGAVGLETWLRRPILKGVFAALWAAAAVICLTAYFLPAYRALPLPTRIEQPLNLSYADTAELIGISPPLIRARPGEQVAVETYWRALSPSAAPLYSYLHSEDPLIRIDSYPGNGHLLATEFEPGQTWTERFVLTIPPNAKPQQVHRLLVGLYDPAARQVIPPEDGSLPLVGTLVISGAPQAQNPAYRFGDAIGLETPQLTVGNDAIRLCLTWDALKAGSADAQVFVHLLDTNGELVQQIDQAPHNGAYPTSVWAQGEQIADCLSLPLDASPAPGWTIRLGMYDAATKTRLPTSEQSGNRLQDDLIVLPL